MNELYSAIQKAFEALDPSIKKHYLPPNPQTLDERHRWLLAAGFVLCPEYRFLGSRFCWWQEEEFTQYLAKFNELHNLNSFRRRNLHELLTFIEDVPGDTAECGVFRGASSWLIMKRTAGQGRTHHCFDSFEGLSVPQDVDGTHWKPGMFAATEQSVAEVLEEVEGASFELHKGWIPERFADVADKQFAFVHIDVDLHDPTRDTLEFFYPRLVPGAVCLCDDYGFTNNPGVNKAMDSFLQGKPEKLIRPASGGGFFIKKG